MEVIVKMKKVGGGRTGQGVGSGWECTLNGSYCENEKKVRGSDQGLVWGVARFRVGG